MSINHSKSSLSNLYPSGSFFSKIQSNLTLFQSIVTYFLFWRTRATFNTYKLSFLYVPTNFSNHIPHIYLNGNERILSPQFISETR